MSELRVGDKVRVKGAFGRGGVYTVEAVGDRHIHAVGPNATLMYLKERFEAAESSSTEDGE